MNIKFTFKVTSDVMTYNKSHTSNCYSLTDENVEKWAFENFKVTINDYFRGDGCPVKCDDCEVMVKYDTDDHSYSYNKDANSNTFHYYIDDDKIHYYTTTTLFDDSIIYYKNVIEKDDNTIDNEIKNVDISLNKNDVYDITKDMAKNLFGVEITKDDFDKAHNMFMQIMGENKNDNSKAENLAIDSLNFDDEVTCAGKDSTCCNDSYDLRGDILYHLDEMKQDEDDTLFHCIKLQIVDKIRQRDYSFANISDNLEDYVAIDNVKYANGIIVNVTGVEQDSVNENVMTELIGFAKLEDFSNVLFDKVQDGTFNVIFKL